MHLRIPENPGGVGGGQLENPRHLLPAAPQKKSSFMVWRGVEVGGWEHQAHLEVERSYRNQSMSDSVPPGHSVSTSAHRAPRTMAAGQ